MTTVDFETLRAQQAWRSRAACHPDRRPEGVSRQEWTALFFPERGNRISPALAICAGCPVVAECRAEAESTPIEREGVWGGGTGRERRREREAQPDRQRSRRPIPHGTEAGAQAHRRRNEKPCADCLSAAARANHARAKQRKQKVA